MVSHTSVRITGITTFRGSSIYTINIDYYLSGGEDVKFMVNREQINNCLSILNISERIMKINKIKKRIDDEK